MRSRVPVIVAALLGSPVIGCSGDTRAEGDLGPSGANPLDAEEQAAFDALNIHRSDKGLPMVAPCVALNRSASAHADDMRDRVYVSDQSPDGTTARDRACAEGYGPACANGYVAELVGGGVLAGGEMITVFVGDAAASAILVAPEY